MALLIAIFGLVLGASLNPIIDRIPVNSPLLRRPDCRYCGRRLPETDWLATLRVLFRGIRCPQCGNAAFSRPLAVELLSAASVAFLWLKLGVSIPFVFAVIYSAIFLVLFFVDLEHRRVPNVIVLPAALLALATGVFQPGIVPALIGGAFGFGALLLLFIINPKGIGAGDVKLAGLIGLLTGWPAIVVGLLFGFSLGGLTAIVLLLSRRVSRRSYIPYAPFLILGAVTALLYGNEIISWYLSRYL